MIAPPPTPTPALEPAFLAAFRGGTLTESQAEAFAHRDPLELKFLLLQLSAAVALIAMSAGLGRAERLFAGRKATLRRVNARRAETAPLTSRDFYYSSTGERPAKMSRSHSS